MLTVPAKHRGIAPAIRQLLSMLFMMIGIVITFSLIVNTLDETELITLFIYGGSHLEDAAVTSLTDSLHVITIKKLKNKCNVRYHRSSFTSASGPTWSPRPHRCSSPAISPRWPATTQPRKRPSLFPFKLNRRRPPTPTTRKPRSN